MFPPWIRPGQWREGRNKPVGPAASPNPSHLMGKDAFHRVPDLRPPPARFQPYTNRCFIVLPRRILLWFHGPAPKKLFLQNEAKPDFLQPVCPQHLAHICDLLGCPQNPGKPRKTTPNQPPEPRPSPFSLRQALRCGNSISRNSRTKKYSHARIRGRRPLLTSPAL
jgi:hypothetical protein